MNVHPLPLRSAPRRAPSPELFRSRPNRLASALQGVLLGLGVATVALPQPATAQTSATALPAGDAVRTFNVPAGPLDAALDRFARNAGVNLSYDPALIAGHTSRGLSGSHSIAAGLAALLAGSGIDAVAQPGGGYTLRKVPRPVLAAPPHAESEPTLPAVQVRASPTSAGESGFSANARISNADHLPIEIEKQPRSITVLTSDLLDRQKNNSLGVVLRNVPSVNQTANGEGTSFITTRGFSAGVFTDGVYAPNVNRTMAAYESIEIHKGPDALLFGGGTPGGAVNFVLKRPKPVAERSYEVGLGYEGKPENTQGFLSLDMTGPVSESVNYRLVLDGIHEEKFYSPSKADRSALFHAAVDWKPNADSKLTAILTEDRRSYNSGSLAGQPAVGTVLPNRQGIRVPLEQVYTDRDYRYTPNNTTFRLEWLQALGDEWSWETVYQIQRHDEFRKISYVAGINAAQDRLNIGLSRYLEDWTQDDDVLTTRLTGRSAIGGLQNLFVGGLQYRHQKYHSPRSQSGATTVSLINPDLDWDDALFTTTSPGSNYFLRQKSVFLQDQLSLSDSVNLLAGIRHDDVDQSSVSTAAGASKLRAAQDKLSWNTGIVWEALPGLNLYGSVNTAFEPTSPGSTDAAGALFKPQETRQYEVGGKYRVAPRLFATAAVFDIVRSNVLTPDPNNALANIQTGEVRSRGLEVELSGEIARGWNVLAAYTHLDPKITEDTVNRGKTFANTPKDAARVFSTYRLGDGPLQGFGFGGGLTYRSERFVDNANTLSLPSYTLADALAWYEIDSKSRIQLNIANLFDKEFYANGRNANRVYPGTPRTVMLSFKSSF